MIFYPFQTKKYGINIALDMIIIKYNITYFYLPFSNETYLQMRHLFVVEIYMNLT